MIRFENVVKRFDGREVLSGVNFEIAKGEVLAVVGPSGTGKTTVARIIAERTNRTLRKLNATTAGISDIKRIIDELDTFLTPGGVLLYSTCTLLRAEDEGGTGRAGRLRPELAWRAGALGDERVFSRRSPQEPGELSVDLLLDASSSRLHCQEVISAQGVILAQSLEQCGIPVRVSCFSSLRGYTVLRVLKSFADKNRQNIFRYFASGWNRDGLALRAAGDLIRYTPGPAPRHLMILLTDASPNDSRRIPPTAENPLGCAYEDAAGVADTAAQVRTLQRQGVRVSAVFMGEDSSAGAAAQIYGKNMARIRGMDQLARAAGRLIQNEIRELGD